MCLANNPADLVQQWQSLRGLLHHAVALLDEAIHGEAGRLAAEQDAFGRFTVFPSGGGLLVAGRIGVQYYICHREKAEPVEYIPAGQPVAIAIFEGDYVRRQTGSTSRCWQMDVAEAWLFRTGYLKLQYEAQKYLEGKQRAKMAADKTLRTDLKS